MWTSYKKLKNEHNVIKKPLMVTSATERIRERLRMRLVQDITFEYLVFLIRKKAESEEIYTKIAIFTN